MWWDPPIGLKWELRTAHIISDAYGVRSWPIKVSALFIRGLLSHIYDFLCYIFRSSPCVYEDGIYSIEESRWHFVNSNINYFIDYAIEIPLSLCKIMNKKYCNHGLNQNCPSYHHKLCFKSYFVPTFVHIFIKSEGMAATRTTSSIYYLMTIHQKLWSSE